MNDNDIYYTDLIARYFSGEIREEELRVLSGWLKSDPGNEESFRQYHKTWLLVEKQKVYSAIDTDQEWIAMQVKMDALSAKAEKPKVILLTSNVNRKKLPFSTFWKVAAAAVVLLVSTFLLYFYITNPGEVVVTAQSENTEQILPDGSVVSLHTGSQITFPEKFNSRSRNIKLSGEAYFKVAHDASKPFIVASGDARVEVLGTRFNVNTKAKPGTMEVVLTSGKVSVYYQDKPRENVMLMPGEKAELTADNKQIRKTINSDPNYMAWKTRILVFENETLGQVIKTLQNVYHSPVTISDQKLAECRVTASFHDQSLQSVLEVLKATLDLQVKQNGKVLEINGKGCN